LRVYALMALGLSCSALAGASVATASAGAGAQSSGGASDTKQSASATTSTPSAHRPVTAAQVVTYAKRFTGVPYVFGANGPRTFDCSGYTSYVYRHFGVRLSRSSYAQMRQGRAVTGRLRLGDLVFWEGGGHVGIYTGNSRFVSATVHRGIWEYSFKTWRTTQPYTAARRLLPATPTPTPTVRRAPAAATASFGTHEPRNGGAADARPAR